MKNKAYWVWLQAALGAGIKTDEIIGCFKTAKAIYEASHEERACSGVFTKKQLEKLNNTPIEIIESIRQDCVRCGCKVLTPECEDYPKRLFEIQDFPLVLYYYGNPAVFKNRMAVAMVGTRDATQTGLTAGYRMSNSLAKSGAVVVSGGALGVDGAAHMGALDAGKETVAVLGCGFMAKYKDSAASLKNRIIKNGLILSEFPPATPPIGRNFPIRNRIISGLSHGVVVVECALRSGSLITARYAKSQFRSVFAIPGDVVNPKTSGTNELICRNDATAVYSARDVLSEFEFIYPDLLDYSKIDSLHLYDDMTEIDFTPVVYSNQKNKSVKEKVETQLTEEKTEEEKQAVFNLTGNAKTVYDSLTEELMHIDDITRKIPSLNVGKIMVAITQLEMKELVISESGKKYRRK